MTPQSSISKKTCIAAVAISTIAASTEWRTQLFITIVAIITVVCQFAADVQRMDHEAGTSQRPAKGNEPRDAQ